MFLKGYHSPIDEPVGGSLYRELGTLITPPDELLEDPAIWLDASHLNLAGAQILSSWLGEQLEALMKAY
jgi:hypothetical protein